MLLRSFLAFSLVGGFSWTASAGVAVRDSLPPMHTLRAEEIDSASANHFSDSVTVFLKNGNTLVYGPEDWDMERYEPTLDKRLLTEIRHVTKLFVRVEHEPEFIGGDSAWSQYIADFCDQHRDVIRGEGATKIVLAFEVHLKGQLTDVEVISNPDKSQLGHALVEYFREGVHWLCAVQNGYKVLAVKRVQVNLVKTRK